MSLKIFENHSLAPLTYYKIGGKARFCLTPESPAELHEAIEFIAKNELPLFILGAGSNILVADEGFDGIVLHTAKLNKKLEVTNDSIMVGASVQVIQVLRLCMKEGLSGLELLCGIPGNMGGVFCMNAGTHLGEIKDVVDEIKTINLRTSQSRTIEKKDLKYSYRKNQFLMHDELIVEGRIKFKERIQPSQVQKSITELLEKRKKSQPIDKPSCGSVFKNPDPQKGLFAWKLIDQAGLRGFRVGDAEISQMHCNFIVNLGHAKAADVRALIEEAKHRVKQQFQIELEEEVQYLPAK